MNKSEFINAIADVTGYAKSDIRRVFNAEIEVMTKALKKGDTVRFTGFGSYSVVKRAARKGHNPRTGASIKIPARNLPKFKAGKTLREAVKTVKSGK